MQVKFKQLSEDAVLPQYGMTGDAGLDLTAIAVSHKKEYSEYKFGIAVEIPDGFFGLMVPRSSITKMDMLLKNSVGIIDSGYRGELVVRFHRTTFFEPLIYNVGDRVAQLIILPYPTIKPVFTETLSETQRGNGGFGSTGK